MAGKPKQAWLVIDMYSTIYGFTTEKKALAYITSSGYGHREGNDFYLSEMDLEDVSSDRLKLHSVYLR